MPIPIIRTARETRAPYDRRRAITGPAASADAARAVIGDPDRETFAVLHLDRKNRILSAEITAIGSVSCVAVGAREIFRAALAADASAIVLAHNHPSGDPEPSPEDRALTRRLLEAGKLIGINVLDHVVLGDAEASRSFVSIRDIDPTMAWE